MRKNILKLFSSCSLVHTCFVVVVVHSFLFHLFGVCSSAVVLLLKLMEVMKVVVSMIMGGGVEHKQRRRLLESSFLFLILYYVPLFYALLICLFHMQIFKYFIFILFS